jgi:hypothetical protein
MNVSPLPQAARPPPTVDGLVLKVQQPQRVPHLQARLDAARAALGVRQGADLGQAGGGSGIRRCSRGPTPLPPLVWYIGPTP